MTKTLALLAASTLVASTLAFAQPYPAKTVKIVVPFAPGGNLDVTARLFAESLAKELGQPFIVENRAGAGGVVGSDGVATSPADGYTLLVGTTGTIVVSPLLVPNPPYQRDSFAAIGMLAITPLLVEVPAASKYQDFKSFVADVKANPGKVTMGHSGNGTTNHIAVLQLQDTLKVSFNIVPYKGSGPALVDLMGGQIDAMVDQTSSSLALVKGGKLQALAVGTKTRIADLPEVATLSEQGLKDFEAVTPSGLFAPAKTPPAIVKTLGAAVNKALADPAVKKKLADLGSEVRVTTSEQFDRFLKDEEAKLKALVKAGVLKPE